MTPPVGDFSRLEIRPGIWLDALGAAFFGDTKTLAIADLHLGYAWAARAQGQLWPMHEPASPAARLHTLCARYGPERIVCVGDVLHRALPIAGIQDELAAFCAQVPAPLELWLLLGNHDRGLERWAVPDHVRFAPELRQGTRLFLHGDSPAAGEGITLRVIGHEHPAIALGDGVATRAKYPCFLVAEGLLVLPAFSRWAAGTPYGQYPFMSGLAREARFTRAVAILGDKLLPVPLSGPR